MNVYKNIYLKLMSRVCVARLSSILNQVSVQRKRAFVGLVLSYWGLKRQARNGAPLIRRLLSSQQGQKTAQLPVSLPACLSVCLPVSPSLCIDIDLCVCVCACAEAE